MSQRDDLPDHLLDAIVGRECLLGAKHAYPHAVSGTLYDRLNVAVDATADDIAAAFSAWKVEGLPRALQRTDAAKVATVDGLVCEAAQVLLSPELRAQYDATLPA
jgi:DnaJ-class molecular chaperone